MAQTKIIDTELHQKLDDFQRDYYLFIDSLKSRQDKIAFSKGISKLNILFENPVKNFSRIKEFFIENEFSFDFKKYYGIFSCKRNKEGEVIAVECTLFTKGFKQFLKIEKTYFERSPSEQMESFVSAVTVILERRLYELKNLKGLRGPAIKQKGSRQELTSLKDIFVKGFDQSIAALKKVDPAIINDENKYILGRNSIGALVAWKDILVKRGNIDNSQCNDDLMATLLKKFFQVKTLTGRTLRSNRTKAYIQYYADLLTLIK